MWHKIVPVIACLLFCAGAGFAQGTPDGETPAEESTCDSLVGATPGLYGLCVAFCEAQDCEPDFAAEDPFGHCRPASSVILDRYNQKKAETDPPMPCLRVPCPCYDEADLAAFFPPYQECRYNWLGVQDLLSDGPSYFASIRLSPIPRLQRCIFRHGLNVTFVDGLSEFEAAGCRSTLTGFMDANLDQCLAVNDYR